jgi:hypothetical protein
MTIRMSRHCEWEYFSNKQKEMTCLRVPMDYVEAGTVKYQQQLVRRELNLLQKLAMEHNFNRLNTNRVRKARHW